MTETIEPVRLSDCGVFLDLAARHDVFFYYRGYFTQVLVEASAEAIRARLVADDADFQTRRRIISTFVEMAQNIVRYSANALSDPAQDIDEVRFGTICVRRTPDGFLLNCSNPVSLSAAGRLEAVLTPLSQMSLEQIRASYRAALKADAAENSKGGGIGLLTLARDSRKPLAFSFTPSDTRPDLAIFHLTAIL